MRRFPELLHISRSLIIALGVVVAARLLAGSDGTPRFATRPAIGQERSVVTPELAVTLSRVAPGERVPVVIQLAREVAPAPLGWGLDVDLRAAQHASNLAGLYSASAERLRLALGSDLAVDLLDAEVVWIGGAVAARLTPAQIRALQGQAELQRVYYDGLIEVDLAGHEAAVRPLVWAPALRGGLQDPAGGLPPGLIAIGAPEVWEAGATGQGTVVAIIDSGVDGAHPLLRRKWRGLTTSAAEGWFDPWGLTDLPVDDDGTGGIGHGTIVASTAVGSLEPGDTLIVLGGTPQVVSGALEVVTGAAPGAEWVAANAFQFFGVAAYTRRSILLQALQWALDPDGDPLTATDVPDVVNNSWGFPTGCGGLFDRAIDALELAGVPVVFAAGNGPPGDSVGPPSNRADLLLNSFAVGAAVEDDDGQFVAAENSLGGPSPCVPGAVKPEVAAPGIVPLVRAVGPNTAQVAGRSGPFTSWASPYATGSLAVLKGLNPGATSNELKGALFSAATDLPPAGLDNRSGAGLIDLPAAAGRIGGLGGVALDLVSWRWDPLKAEMNVELFNRGSAPFPGGRAELIGSGTGEPLARASVPEIRSRSRGAVLFADLGEDPVAEARLRLRLESGGTILELPLALASSTATSVRIEEGSVQFSLDASGRLGAVAGSPGFVFLGNDWLTAGAFMLAAQDRVSDAAYVDVLGQPALKSNPVGSDTDWSGQVLADDVSSARVEYSDRRALLPTGASIVQSASLTSIADSAAFVLLTITVEIQQPGEASMAGLMLDWDFGRRERVFWSDELGASVMTPADTAGPWLALSTAPNPPTIYAAVPMGEPVFGFYDFGSGVLADTVCRESACFLTPFSDESKIRFLRLGGPQASSASVADWAHLVATGPLAANGVIHYLIAAGSTEAALRVALDSARASASSSFMSGPTSPADGSLQLLPAYPNPFNPAVGDVVKVPYLVNRVTSEVQAALEIFTVAGRLVYSETRNLLPNEPLEPFTWDGRLPGGDLAATGMYGYVLQVGREKRSGRLLLLK